MSEQSWVDLEKHEQQAWRDKAHWRGPLIAGDSERAGMLLYLATQLGQRTLNKVSEWLEFLVLFDEAWDKMTPNQALEKAMKLSIWAMIRRE